MMTMMAESKAGESGSFVSSVSEQVITSDAAITKAAVAWFPRVIETLRDPVQCMDIYIYDGGTIRALGAPTTNKSNGLLVGQVGPSRNGRQRYFIER